MLVRDEIRYSFTPHGPWSGWALTSVREVALDAALWRVSEPAEQRGPAVEHHFRWFQVRSVPFDTPRDPRPLVGWGWQPCTGRPGASCV